MSGTQEGTGQALLGCGGDRGGAEATKSLVKSILAGVLQIVRAYCGNRKEQKLKRLNHLLEH